MTHPNTYEQSYRYFLQEAEELLQVIEQELLNLREGYSLNKVYTLMRATHTLKGAAASIGLETITTVAHSLEDIFRAICKPNLLIDSEVEAILFEGYECLYLSLSAKFTDTPINDVEILHRITAIHSQLQEKLGSSVAQEGYLPSSQELGFDFAQSIFEIGVARRLEQLATAIESVPPKQVAQVLQTQAEVFLGLGESLNLSGFQAIAQAVLAALNNHPEEAVTIARIALENFQQATEAVLDGDRAQGGQPSLALQQLSERQTSAVKVMNSPHEEPPFNSSTSDRNNTFSSSSPPPLAPNLHQVGFPNSSSPTPSPSSDTVRVKVEHLEQLNYLIGELLTNQNRLSLQNQQLETAVRVLTTRLQKQEQQLNQLQDRTGDFELDLNLNNLEFWETKEQSQNLESQIFNSDIHKYTQIEQTRDIWSYPRQIAVQNSKLTSLQPPTNQELQSYVQSLLENTVQLTEATEAIEMFVRQSHETLEKQRRLLTNTSDALMEARMLPLGHLFERFHRILEKLEFIHKKQVYLELQGNETLVDKAVVEKLYDPLLHLVRNAFDHGIESPKARQMLSKSEKGLIEISAYYEGRYLVVEVRDDGQGLDFEKIRTKAVESQLLSLEQARRLNNGQLTDLIFEPGFSTAAEVNDLSGRGIGLDIVRSHLQALQGSVVVSSEAHQGTMFRLQIPLSLTITKLLLCQAGNKIYALFSDTVEEILIPRTDQIRCWESGKILRWDKDGAETLIPIYQLATALNYCSSVTPSLSFQPKRSFVEKEHKMMPIILINCQDKLLGLEVDQLLGDQELVIRPLGGMIVPPHYVYGSSILADGRLALVLEATALMEFLCEQQSHDSTDDHFVTSASLITTSKLQQPQLLSQIRTTLPKLPYSNFREPDNTILLVDDSITVRHTLSLTLQKAGYQVIQVQDGYEAIEQLRCRTDIHLVFCDIEMPRMNGFEFLKNRQQDPDLAEIPVVMLTSKSSEEHRSLAMKLGANAYITKPYLEYMLLAAVTDLLNKKQQDL